MRSDIRAAVVVLAALASGCSRGADQELGRRIADEVAKGVGTVVRIADLTDFSWERLCVFAPYSSREYIERELGFAWPEAENTGIRDSDGLALLVFVWRGAVVRYVTQPRNKGDFALAAGGFSPSRAVFHVFSRDDGVLAVVRPRRLDGGPPSGTVLATTGERVTISVGSRDGACVGDWFYLSRGAIYVGRIRVTETDTDKAVGLFDMENLGGGAPPKIGDKAGLGDE